MLSRFVQALGGSIGSVLGQTICRDTFHGPQLGKVYSIIGIALGVFPILGPLIGGVIAEYYGWSNIFLFLSLFTIILILFVMSVLSETLHNDKKQNVSMMEIGSQIIRDQKVIGLCLILAMVNGIGFSYFAEGSFYLIDILGLSPSEYGYSFVIITVFAIMGATLTKKMQNYYSLQSVLFIGLIIVLLSNLILGGAIFLHNNILPLSISQLISITIFSQMICKLGTSMVIINTLSLALVDYQWCVGTASGIFNFILYALISLFTFGMGYFHDGTLLVMPLYFTFLSIMMLIINQIMVVPYFQYCSKSNL